MAFDGNIQKNNGSVSLSNDIPSGTIVATIPVENGGVGYNSALAEVGIYDNNLIINDNFSGSRWVIVYWFYHK